MINRCKQVPLDGAQSGMVLAEAVLDSQRSVLLPEATVLSDSMLRSLERRGVKHVLVVDNEIPREEWDAACRRMEDRLARLFRRCTGKGASDTLRQYITEYRTGSGT
ncbi:hypothetical protein [Noviherbaspirillum sp. ST9]|uniref:hypothetical protein n=1 Tax=Noviherbaspirillum sp. ST9 TaxID=3401606 RepID=UPI003B58A131